MIDPGLQVALSVGVPTLAVLVGILINNSRHNDLRSHMDARFDDMRELGARSYAALRRFSTQGSSISKRTERLLVQLSFRTGSISVGRSFNLSSARCIGGRSTPSSSSIFLARA